ncbi:MAG: YlxM family DNA-binding protein [Anaerorhabdus sp.]
MENKEKINLYLDFYEKLLTEKQQKICDYYYREDYSLSEIAELEKISRSAVHDAIKKSTSLLEELEDKLQDVASFKQRIELYRQIKKYNHSEINQLIESCIETE